MTLRRLSAGITATALMVGVVTACSSVPDITFTDTPDADVATDAGDRDAGDRDVANDAPRDASVDPSCVKTGPESCEDGLDNDCNGLVDCADPACQPTHQCVDAVPVGWDLVAFSPNTRPACPAGYGAAVDIKDVLGTGSGTCSCSCSPDVGSCAPVGVVVGNDNACGGAPVTVTPNANCTPLPTNVVVPTGQTFGSIKLPAKPTSCAPSTTLAGGTIAEGRTCAAPPTTGKGCQGNQVCIKKPTGLGLCVTKPGQNACPLVFTQQRTAGSDATTDNRNCNACTCGTADCTGTIELFEAANCATGGGNDTTGPLGTACVGTASKNFTATRYKTANTNNGCTVTAFNSAMTGSIAWAQQSTICCKP